MSISYSTKLFVRPSRRRTSIWKKRWLVDHVPSTNIRYIVAHGHHRFWSDPKPDQVRGEVASWLAEHWDPNLSLVQWRRQLASEGWIAPSWPTRWHGRGLPAWADDVVSEELPPRWRRRKTSGWRYGFGRANDLDARTR